MYCFRDPKHKVDWAKHVKEGGPLFCPRGHQCHYVLTRDQHPEGFIIDGFNLLEEGLDISKAQIMNLTDCPKWKGEK